MTDQTATPPVNQNDAFRQKIAEGQDDTAQGSLAHQSLGRPLTEAEQALASALMEIYGTGEHDLVAVAAALTDRGVAAPISGRFDWDVSLLENELTEVNRHLDAAYDESGYGA